HADEKPRSTVTGTRGDSAALMNPAPLTVPSANSILDGVVIGAPTPADLVGRYAAPDILRMNALPPALVRIIPATRVDAEALAPAVEPTEPSPCRSFPQPDPGAPDGGLEPGFARPKSLSVAMSLNSECRQGGGKLYEVYLVCRLLIEKKKQLSLLLLTFIHLITFTYTK